MKIKYSWQREAAEIADLRLRHKTDDPGVIYEEVAAEYNVSPNDIERYVEMLLNE